MIGSSNGPSPLLSINTTSLSPPSPEKTSRSPSRSKSAASAFFFFKQKTAYEIGLGIPAEPLFRSHSFPRQQEPYDQYHENSHAKHWDYHKTRSEERRVGKERRSRWSAHR